ncbi:site-specific integrase [Arcicella sp. LKC2W]|uniref:site-specific integrase n=1 Tax=Arcicella sp. LKC2W TaxID=2984198 RepID=UPI002B1F0F1B|nr:site-specific integrase [Arcicella sp. LKC2W]MEA5460298.1 site-specific integrase [Arcicella sp. LKC2W]
MKSLYVRYEFIFNRKKSLNSNGEALIQIRMYLNGLNKFYSTGIYVKPSEWNESKNVPKSPILLRKVNSIKQELSDFEFDYRKRFGSFELKHFDRFGEVLELPSTEKIKETSFVHFMVNQHLAEKSLRQASWGKRLHTLKVFNEFRPNVSFSEINYSLIEGFDFFLHSKKLHANTIANHHKHIKKYILRAIKDDLIEQKANPYLFFKVKKVEARSQFLTSDEIERLENLVFEESNTIQERVRDMFLFGIYTGLRFNDIYKLRKMNFYDSPDGMVLNYQANKTLKHGVKFLDILFYGKPRKIVDKYIPDDNTKTLFKGLTNPKVNIILKTLSTKARIAKPLCFKDARDTFATQLINLNLPLTIIQAELQHGNIRITSKYLHVTGDGTKKAMKNLWKQ